MSQRYLLDTDALVQAKRAFYSFDFCPAFWDLILRGHAAGRVHTVDRVATEIARGKDDLSQWIDSAPAGLILDTATPATVIHFGEVMTWVQQQDRLTPAAVAQFADEKTADGWLIASAMEHQAAVVTHESSAPHSKTKVKIPDICDAFGVPHTNLYTLIRGLSGRFVLGA